MKKTLLALISFAIVIGLLAGCRANQPSQPSPSPSQGADDGQIKTGYAVISSAEKSAAKENGGTAQVDSTIVGVIVDGSGKILNCAIDAVQTIVEFDGEGKLVTPKDTIVPTKTELGTEYGMKKASKIGKEWDEQIKEFAKYVVGKTVDEVKGIAVSAEGAPTDAELSSTVTIKIGGYVAAIEKAVKNAKPIGSGANDKIGIGVSTNIKNSKDATSDADGVVQAYSTYSILTLDSSDKITASIIDASQVEVKFSKDGKITSDTKAAQKTKNELGTEYGMKKASGIGKEWNEQAEAFAKYTVGKTVSEVNGIAIDETTVPQVDELKSSVTIKVGDLLTAIEKAGANAK
ncbi:MAG: hypothetical protein PHF89_00115 [Eubacteriales bacterium]|jgi:hypothetical protein|nr:hypothetical protein [Eubacteriales bacterium]